ncbi:DUF4358 domain-containing protein [Flavonifractor plautii]|nr:DUF4358 domain-containing protein [Flavonifractor plautii]
MPGPHRLRRRRGGGPDPYDPETAAQALLDSGAFSDALDTVDQDTAAALYGIDADTITGSAVYTSLSAGAEEIAVLVLTDEDAAAAALDGLEARVADQKAVLESYQPDEVSKLDSAIVEQRAAPSCWPWPPMLKKPGPPWTGWSNLCPPKSAGYRHFFQTLGWCRV